MLDDWYRPLHLPMAVEQFHALPRNPAYKYEYLDGQAWLTPKPRTFNALLDLKLRPAPDAVEGSGHALSIRPLAAADWNVLPRLFASAFEAIPPFICLNAHDRLQAASEAIHQTKSGGDGPVIEPACFVAEDEERVVGAILVTLIPRRKEGEWWDGTWLEEPKTEDARHLLGCPHLTWVFVAPRYAHRGLGSTLLAHSINALVTLEYNELASTFLFGNESTMLWHWRNGFRVLPHPGSMRRK
jgi:GNAT superfamily N-acetyltransferase